MIEAPPEPGKCCQCGGRIPAPEPEVVLTHTPNAAQLHFHAGCGLRAFWAAIAEPAEWVFTYRPIDPEEN